MSKALKILAENLDSLIGEGRRFRNDADMGEATGLGQRKIHRLRNQTGEPKLDNLDTLSERLHIPIPALLSPQMNILAGGVNAEVRDIVVRLCALAESGKLEAHDLAHLNSAMSLIEKTKSALPLSSENRKRAASG